MAHRTRSGSRIQPAVRPEVGSAHARGREADDRVGRIDDGRRGALLEAHVTRTVENCPAHGLIPFTSHSRLSYIACPAEADIAPWLAQASLINTLRFKQPYRAIP